MHSVILVYAYIDAGLYIDTSSKVKDNKILGFMLQLQELLLFNKLICSRKAAFSWRPEI